MSELHGKAGGDKINDKAQSLAERMNKITEKFSKNLDTAEELVITGEDVVDYVADKTKDIQLTGNIIPATEVVNLSNMVEDFQYVRTTLRENIDNGRRILNAVTLDLLNVDDDVRAGLITSYAELNKAMAQNIELYYKSYKEISTVLLNIDKIKKADPNSKNSGDVINNLNVFTSENTLDLIKKLKEGKNV